MSSGAVIEGETILGQHGSGAGDNVTDPSVNVTGELRTESIDHSFEEIPPPQVSPPGLTERQRAAFERADQIPISSVPSSHGDESTPETTMAMLRIM